jgi:hypothetical protein
MMDQRRASGDNEASRVARDDAVLCLHRHSEERSDFDPDLF